MAAKRTNEWPFSKTLKYIWKTQNNHLHFHPDIRQTYTTTTKNACLYCVLFTLELTYSTAGKKSIFFCLYSYESRSMIINIIRNNVSINTYLYFYLFTASMPSFPEIPKPATHSYYTLTTTPSSHFGSSILWNYLCLVEGREI